MENIFKLFLESTGMNNKDLAKRIGCSPNTLQKYMSIGRITDVKKSGKMLALIKGMIVSLREIEEREWQNWSSMVNQM